jgi:transcriptional regulator with XRE-family HTH domain
MNPRKNNTLSPDDVFRTMREMLAEAPSSEVHDLAREAGMDVGQLVKTSRKAVSQALDEGNQQAKTIILHQGLSSLLIMLRRRDGLDEQELARKAQVDEEEIRRIEFDTSYMPSPRTIYNIEEAFSLPNGVIAKLCGAIKQNSPTIEDKVLEFAANAKTMGKLTRAERQIINAFVQWLSEQG